MIDVAFFTALLLVFLRICAFVVTVPVFFPQGTNPLIKVILSMIIAYTLMPGIDYSYITVNISTLELLIYCLCEISTGLTFGFIVSLCFYCIRVAGYMLDTQVGFSMISLLDPSNNSNVTLIERLLYWFSLITFLIIDGHHMLIRTLVESFNIIHLGNFILHKESALLIIKIFIQFFELGLKIAIPIVLIIILTDLTLGLVAKVVPQLNVMILGLPLKVLLGLMVLSLSLPMIYSMIGTMFNDIPSAIRKLYKIIPLVIIFASDDKTEEATPHKLSEARKKGQVAKSKEVNTAFTLITSTIVLITLGEFMVNSFKEDIIHFLTGYSNLELNEDSLQSIATVVVVRFAIVAFPMILPIMVIGIAANLFQTGYINTVEPLKPQLSKLNPLSGLKRMFSLRTFVDLIKDVVMVIIVGFIGYGFLKSNFRKVLTINTLKYPDIITNLLKLMSSIFLKISLAMVAIALVDYLYQKLQFKKEMKMTKQEVKEEFKQMEGDPEVKGKIKQKQREFASRRMMQRVPDATVVITNPTHIAVALKYEDGKDNAPVLVAKGSDHIAIKIKEIAKENHIPIIENKQLARLIYKEVELENEIPSDMYQAVAEILALVYKLNRQK